MILPETTIEGASMFAEKIRRSVEALGENGLTLSAGVATMGQTNGSSSALVEAADANLYRAKADGRNRVVTGS